MDRETIEKAANEKYADNTFAYKGFITGAEWRINAAWHNPEEVPEANREYLILYFSQRYYFSDTRIDFEYLGKEYWSEYVKTKGIKRWAYISDLIPDGKEGHQ